MDNKTLESITNSITKKLGKETAALIADDIGTLITKNTEAYDSSVKKDEEIKQLKSNNEKLVIANGNLLQQIPMGNKPYREDEVEKESKSSNFNFRDAFDENGRFKK